MYIAIGNLCYHGGVEKIEFSIDKLKVAGPHVDGGLTITLWAGQYESVEISKLLASTMMGDMQYRVTIEPVERKDNERYKPKTWKR